jgi:AcrR family transcriptional regulator
MPDKPPPPSPSPAPPRWRRRPEERPQQILEAAFKVFGVQGLHQATLDDVAREAGITKGTIYLYFPGKAALFGAMLQSRVGEILPPLEAAADGREPAVGPRELAAFGRRLYRFMRSPAYLTMFRTIVGEAAQFPEAAEGVFRNGILVANRRMAAVLARGMAAGRFRELDPLVASRAFAGMFLVFAVSQGLLGGERVHPIPEATVVKTVTDLFLNGLMKSRASRGTAEARRRGSKGKRRSARDRDPATPRTVEPANRRPADPANRRPARPRAGGRGARSAP